MTVRNDDYKIKHQLRPQARKIFKSRALEADMEVLVNYNLQDPGRRGCCSGGENKFDIMSSRNVLSNLI